jgi:hypothetical protein
MLGCVAAVMETESPSQPRPAVIHKMWISAVGCCFGRHYQFLLSGSYKSRRERQSLREESRNSALSATYPANRALGPSFGTDLYPRFRLG